MKRHHVLRNICPNHFSRSPHEHPELAYDVQIPHPPHFKAQLTECMVLACLLGCTVLPGIDVVQPPAAAQPPGKYLVQAFHSGPDIREMRQCGQRLATQPLPSAQDGVRECSSLPLRTSGSSPVTTCFIQLKISSCATRLCLQHQGRTSWQRVKSAWEGLAAHERRL